MAPHLIPACPTTMLDLRQVIISGPTHKDGGGSGGGKAVSV